MPKKTVDLNMIIKPKVDEIITNAQLYDKKLLVSSERENAGLYIVDSKTRVFKKVFDGSYRGVIKYADGYIALKHPDKLVFLDFDLSLRFEIDIQDCKDNSGLHGLAISQDGFIYIAEAVENKVFVYNSTTYKKEAELVLSNECPHFHHINDLLVIDNELYISMFSVIGNWKARNIITWDGAIVKFDRINLEPIDVFIGDLKAPHSITFSNNNFYYCDSLRLNVTKFDPKLDCKEVIAQCNGFTRGLYVDDLILVIGQSKMRHLQRMNGWYNNISLDAGVCIYDLQYKVSSFIYLPVENVYSVLVYQN